MLTNSSLTNARRCRDRPRRVGRRARLARPDRRLDDVGRSHGRQQRRRQLAGLHRVRSAAATWARPGRTNGGAALQPPAVANVYHRSLLPEPGEPVTVFATITDSDGTITSASVFYQVNGGGFGSAGHEQHPVTTTPAPSPRGRRRRGRLLRLGDRQRRPDHDQPRRRADQLLQLHRGPRSDHAHRDDPRRQCRLTTAPLVQIQAQVYIPGNYQADGPDRSAPTSRMAPAAA